jgi:hypothetical protein
MQNFLEPIVKKKSHKEKDFEGTKRAFKSRLKESPKLSGAHEADLETLASGTSAILAKSKGNLRVIILWLLVVLFVVFRSWLRAILQAVRILARYLRTCGDILTDCFFPPR